MRNTLLISLRIFLIFTLLFGGLYPLAISLVAAIGFSDGSKGSILYEAADPSASKILKPVGSEWIGQYNRNPRYFWPRPSATTPPYNAANSGSSNMFITDDNYKELLQARIAELRNAHPSFKEPIPADMVTASASGLDPHISPQAARMQIDRVAMARGMPKDKVAALVEKHVEQRQFSLLGEKRVNVLKLNIALDSAP